MAVPSVMIGMMKCNIGDIDCGSVKSASVTVKPQYKEHKTGYPQISDLKALTVAEGVCRVESEESTLMPLVRSIARGLSSGTPQEVKFTGNAPGLGGTALTISGTGFGSSSGISGKMEDFGFCTLETTCIDLVFTGSSALPNGNNIGGVPFIVPVAASQAITLDPNNLYFGAPTVNTDLCQTAQFNCSSKVRYLMIEWATQIDAGIMESTEFNIAASYMSGTATDLTKVTAAMVPGTVSTPQTNTFSLPTIGGAVVSITMDGIVEADLSFSPGNDWNGIAVKYTALLTDPTKIGTNWANIS